MVKKRVAVGSRGKSRGIRTLVATNKENLWVFVFGFSKNDRANISDVELEALQFLTEDLLNLTNLEMKDAVQDGSLQEICHDQPNQSEESHTRRRA
ncbi:type II toxin-antitoxin system RelE/ParE family toxin [Pigmentiphaga sp.]|uniref:type II toxin-antitoxin system RelE/ParE family toxin n=1 Tax=Pigmentiphaga sp. TaxID=1977564 RepID=UPI0025D702B4|nr:type II toxin-antitoxin system RelE/ParE family toxin [Pigmentiphaga sp.]